MRPTARSRAVLAVFAASAFLLGLVACGTAEQAAVSGQSAAQAASTADRWDEETLVPAMKAALEKQESVHVTVTADDGSGASYDVEADVALRGERPELVATTDRTPFGGPAEIRVVDGIAYASMAPMTPEGKFVEMRLDERSSPFGGMEGMREIDPEQAFDALETGLREVAYVGEETVQGERLGHYRLTVDPRAAAEESGMPGAAEMPGAENGGPHMGRMPREVTFDVWVDGDALVHRLELDKRGHGSAVVSLTEWDAPVTVEAPPRADIVELNGGWPAMSGHSRS